MLISIIIPVFNAELYLGKCLDTIVNQISDSEKIEIILIDDGSTDSSFDICKLYEQKYNCIKVIHQENKGVSASRNKAVSAASGEYIMFVDADDCLLDGALNTILVSLSEDDADYYIFPFEKEVKKGVSKRQTYSRQGCVVNANEAYRYIFSDGKNAPWSKLFKKAIIDNNNIFFNENIKIHEDVVFCMDYLESCGNVKYCDKPIYFYRMNAEGAVQKHKIEYLDNYNFVYNKWKKFFASHGLDEYFDELNSMFLYKMAITCGKLIKHGTKKEKVINSLLNNPLYNQLLSYEFKKPKDRLFQFILKYKFFEPISLKVK